MISCIIWTKKIVQINSSTYVFLGFLSRFTHSLLFRKTPKSCFYSVLKQSPGGVLWKFARFTETNLCWGLKILKYLWILQNFIKHLLYRTPPRWLVRSVLTQGTPLPSIILLYSTIITFTDCRFNSFNLELHGLQLLPSTDFWYFCASMFVDWKVHSLCDIFI